MVKERRLAKLIGEHEVLISVEKEQDFNSTKEIILLPIFHQLMRIFAEDLNIAKLTGSHLIRFRMDCHAEPNEAQGDLSNGM
ncbi:MAG TPA: hypothetical protein ACFYDZ_00410 [Candidatus Brocadiaceae bacterium]